MTKKRVLKKHIENILIYFVGISMAIITMTVENIGNTTYNTFLIIILPVIFIATLILKKYSRLFND